MCCRPDDRSHFGKRFLTATALASVAGLLLAATIGFASPPHPAAPEAPAAVSAGPDLTASGADSTAKPGAGTLDAFEDDLSDDDGSDSRDRRQEEDDDEEGSFWGAFAGELFWQVAPSLLFGVSWSDDRGASIAFADAGFTAHPYARPGTGMFAPHASRLFAADGSAAWFRQDGDLTGLVASARFAPVPLVGIEAQVARFSENLHPGTSDLTIADAFANYYRVRSPRWALWWGVGAKLIHGRTTHAGFAMNLATRIYPVDPISLRLQANVGFVEEEAVTGTLVGLAGHWGRIAPFAGYQTWSTGRTTLKGLVAGLDVHF